MSDAWLTYDQAAEKLGVSRQAVRQKAIRGRWPRTRGNDGQARVQVPEQPYRVRTASVPVSNTSPVDALRAQIEQLAGELAQRDAILEQERQCHALLVATHARLVESHSQMAADLAALALRLTQPVPPLLALPAPATGDDIGPHPRPWWRRWRRASSP
jgi:hypothetical protein